jgi:exo-poly-alpha-galacturonosidase
MVLRPRVLLLRRATSPAAGPTSSQASGPDARVTRRLFARPAAGSARRLVARSAPASARRLVARPASGSGRGLVRRLAPCVVLLAAFGITAAAPAQAAGRPAAPTEVRVPALANDDTSITLAWEKPAAHSGITDYHVYLDGKYAGSADAANASAAKQRMDAFYAANSGQVRAVTSTYTATGLRPGSVHRFTVRAVDAAGTESRDSKTVVARTTATPKVFDITAYGAVGDGTTLNTKAIQAAIDACTYDCKVLVPAGTYKTGALWLKSHMTLDIAQGATLLGSADAADYPYHYRLYDYSTDQRYYSLINAHTREYGSLEDIRIVGQGTIDGNGWKLTGTSDGFPVYAKGSATTVGTTGILAKAQVEAATALGDPTPYGTRSNLITLRGVKNVYVGGITAVNPSQHTLVFLHSDNVTVNGVQMKTYNANNADGIEFTHGSGLTVTNNVFDTGDDCMNFAAGLGADSESDPPTQNAWISGNYFKHGHGAVVIGSHTGAWIQHIVAEDNVVNGTDVGLRMKTNPTNGGGGQDIVFRDNAMKDIGTQGFIFTSAYSDPTAAITVAPTTDKAVFQDVTVQNVTVDGTGSEAISVVGVADQPHRRLHFDGVHFLKANPAALSYLKDSSFTDVVFDSTASPWKITNSSGLTFGGSTTTTPVTADASSPPEWPAGATATVTATDDHQATLSWSAASDDTGVAGYEVVRDGTVVATSTTTSATVTGLSPARTYGFTVRAVDATGNRTAGPAVTARTTGTPDTTPPVTPDSGVSLVAAPGTTWAQLTWKAATDDSAVDHYDVYADGTKVVTVPGTATGAVPTGLTPATAYTFTVKAVDEAGNATAYRPALTATTAAAWDATVPSWPHGARLTVTRVSATAVRLSWPAATDNVGVIGYRIYQNRQPVGGPFTPIDTAATTAQTSYVIDGLRPGTAYTFTVQAGDAAGNWTGSGLTR